VLEMLKVCAGIGWHGVCCLALASGQFRFASASHHRKDRHVPEQPPSPPPLRAKKKWEAPRIKTGHLLGWNRLPRNRDTPDADPRETRLLLLVEERCAY